MNPFARLLRLAKRMHWPMVVPVAAAMVIGVFFIFSSCYISEDLPVKSYYRKQVGWIVVGMVAYVTAALYDYRKLGDRWSWPLYLVSILLLVLVLVAGRRIYGARRWLMIPGTGAGIQPSEIAKLATLVLTARLLSFPELDLRRLRTFLVVLALVLVPMLMVLKQPDLGTSLVFLPPALAMMFVAGVPLRYIGTLVTAGVLSVVLVLGAILLPEVLPITEETRAHIHERIPLTEYQQERIMVLFWPDRDPLGSGWNRNQSLIAVGSGGMKGKGFLQGTQNILGFLPRSVAPTDFIYSVIAEEKGFVGSMVVLMLYVVVTCFGAQVAAATTDRMGRLLVVGIVVQMFCHVWINIAMTVGLVPITGLPLPLLSYGGSFLVTTLAALGLIQSVYIRSPRRLFA